MAYIIGRAIDLKMTKTSMIFKIFFIGRLPLHVHEAQVQLHLHLRVLRGNRGRQGAQHLPHFILSQSWPEK